MAGMFTPMSSNAIRLLDAGAGAGALSFAFADRWTEERAAAATLAMTAYELDEAIQPALAECLDGFQQIRGIETRLVKGDFLEHAATMIRLERGERYTHAILNPPYKKISTASTHRHLLRAAGVETVNLYSGFVALSLELLEQGGEMVAIIPRSFCNGPYYEPFRHFLLERAALRRIHLFGARNKAFKSDGVLQENVIIHLERGAPGRGHRLDFDR
jgi:tRNA1(Val) A37 N6-methylase TrmN6